MAEQAEFNLRDLNDQELTEQVHDPSPDVGRNQCDVSQPAFFDRTQ